MTALSGESPGPHVPREVFDRLSLDEQNLVRRRVQVFVLSEYRGSVILKTSEEKTSFANLSVTQMLRYKSCDYLTGDKGIDTLVGLAIDKAKYLYMEEIRKYHNDLEKGREPPKRLEEYNDDWQKHQELVSNDDQSSSNSEAQPSERLRAWFRDGAQQGNNYHQSTREKLLEVIDLIFHPDGRGERLFNFDDDCISLKAGPIAEALGWQDDNIVSKLAAKLNEIRTRRAGPTPPRRARDDHEK